MRSTKYRLGALPVIALTLATAVTPAHAQRADDDEDRPALRDSRRLENALNDLNLTDAQREQLRRLSDTHRQSTEALRNQIRSAQQTIASTPRTDPNYDAITAEANKTLETARVQLRAQQQSFRDITRGLLTPDQLNTLESKRAERQKRMSERMEERRGGEQRQRRFERRPGGG